MEKALSGAGKLRCAPSGKVITGISISLASRRPAPGTDEDDHPDHGGLGQARNSK
jgi:hypothetical protein